MSKPSKEKYKMHSLRRKGASGSAVERSAQGDKKFLKLLAFSIKMLYGIKGMVASGQGPTQPSSQLVKGIKENLRARHVGTHL